MRQPFIPHVGHEEIEIFEIDKGFDVTHALVSNLSRLQIERLEGFQFAEVCQTGIPNSCASEIERAQIHERFEMRHALGRLPRTCQANRQR